MPNGEIDERQLRSDICNKVYGLASVLAVPAMAISLSRISAFGWQPVLGMQIGLVIAVWLITIFRHRLPYAVRASFLMALAFLVGFGGFTSFGPAAGGIAWMVAAPVVGTAFFGQRIGFASLAVGIIITMVFGIYTLQTGQLPSVDHQTYFRTWGAWATISVAIGLAGGMTLMVTSLLTGNLMQALQASKEKNEAIEKSEATYRRLVENLPEIIYTYSGQEGYTYFSPAVRNTCGYSNYYLMARPQLWMERVHPDDLDSLKAAHAACLDGAPFELLYRIRDKRDEWRWCQDRSIACAEEDGEQVISGIITDVTESRAREQQLQRAQKMESVGQLTGGIAHDFNNLLSVLQGNLELLQETMSDLDEDASERRMVEKALGACARGSHLTHRLLAFSRKQSLAPQVINAGDLVDGLMDLMKRTIGANVQVNVVRSKDLWRCVADPAQLESAILNLAINARDAMPEGGHLTIALDNAELDEDYAAATGEAAPGQYVRVAVTDTGAGIASSDLKNVFEPFFTTKEVGKGSGLGLSMVYGFVKQSNGHVSIYSEPGQGTTVTLYLPRSEQDVTMRPTVEPASDVMARDETVLVVEDDPDVRTLLVVLLSDLGYSILEAQDGPTALRLLENASTVDLLLSDMVLPAGMSGTDLAEQAREVMPGLPVLYISGYSPEALYQQGRIGGEADLLKKPFRRDDLSMRVRAAIDRARVTPAASGSA